MIGLQALEAGFKREADIFPIQRLVWSNTAVIIARGAADLRGEDDFLTIAALRQPVTDVGLGQSLRFRARGTGYISATSIRLIPWLMA
jgi:hypothetical protein